MNNLLRRLERIARNAYRYSDQAPADETQHPFEIRDIHPALPDEVRRLFDNGHYSQATFEACKFLDAEMKRHSGLDKSGEGLMMEALKDAGPLVQLSPLATETDRNEQRGYRFLFAGTMIGIRNPRGHEHSLSDPIGTCLEHLTLASHLLRRLEKAGFHPAAT